MKAKLQRIKHLLFVLIAAFSVFTGGLLLNTHPSYAYSFTNPVYILGVISSDPSSWLKIGSTGDEVKQLQAKLNEKGASPSVTVDGKFGPGTAYAVLKFQIKNGLGPDSQVGPKTKAALGL